MLREERLRQILERLRRDQRVSSTELMREFRVSEGTIRRDLNELEEQGLLRKVHGGAVSRPLAPRVYDGRMSFASERKAKLAQKALPLIEDGQLLLIDGGTSNWHLARALPMDLRVTVFTNSFPIVEALMAHPHIELVFLGGQVFKASQVAMGADSFQALGDLRADLCFLGVRSLHPRLGLTTLNREEARLKRKMTEVSNRVVVLATTDKLDTVDHYKICEFEAVDTLVVEEDADAALLDKFRALGVTVLT